MCGRFFTADSYKPLDDAIQALAHRNLAKFGEVSPGDLAAVIASNRKMEPAYFGMNWGYRLPDGKLVFNTRSETASQHPMFADGIAQRRCIIPANYYFEWQRSGNVKTKFAISPKEYNGCLLAGIYRIEGQMPVFSILTKEPSNCIAFIHPRMPVILPEGATKDWLNPRFNGMEILASAIDDMQYKICE